MNIVSGDFYLEIDWSHIGFSKTENSPAFDWGKLNEFDFNVLVVENYLHWLIPPPIYSANTSHYILITPEIANIAATIKKRSVNGAIELLGVVSEPPVGRFQNRRKSVFAETYDPEEDEDDDGTRTIFPKSDEQRQCLSEAVRNILLFRSLEKEQMNEVLDAMFERKVAKDELVIKQGDDGDNFYVIQR